jgi:hypothetical protein
MTGLRTALASVATLLFTAAPCAALTPAERLARFEATFAPTGETTRCLSLAALDHTRIIDDRHILFRVGVDTHYVNVLPRPCRGLSHRDALVIDSRNGRLCDVDWVRAVDSALPFGFGLRGPACGLGEFVRLERREAVADGPQR